MTRIIVVSDSHGLRKELRMIREKHPEADAYLHCGDSELDKNHLDGWVSVLGNMDFYVYPKELVIDVNGVNVYMTHSHLIDYRDRTKLVAKEAARRNCKIALFGHSHLYFCEEIDGIICVNPGSLRYNRDRSLPSYAIIDIDSDQKVSVRRINLES